VALKMIPPAMLQNETAGKRFQREVEAMSRVSHPNIVAAFDAGEDKGACFLILEFVEGRDLSRTIKNGRPLSVEDAVEYTLQAARGLAHAHAMGIVHRDIKPANLLLSKEGVVKILDMGLARVDDPNSTNLTQTGSIMGTVDYMPPEQTMDSKAADHRADIYSLGCTLFHLATGRPVYESESLVGKIIAHREEPIPSLLEVRPEIPPRLDQIFQRMVAKDPDDRYQSMQEVVEHLENLYDPPGPEEDLDAPVVDSPEPEHEHELPRESAGTIKGFFDSTFGFVVTMLVALAAMLGFLTWWMFGRT